MQQTHYITFASLFGYNCPTVSSFEWAKLPACDWNITGFFMSHFQLVGNHAVFIDLSSFDSVYSHDQTEQWAWPSPWNLDWDHEWGPCNSWADFWYFFRSLNQGSVTACPCWWWCVWFCWLVPSHATIVWYGTSKNKIKVWGLTIGSLHSMNCHWVTALSKDSPFQGNWSCSWSLEVLTVAFTCTTQRKEFTYWIGSRTLVTVLLINKKRSWMITLF